MSKPIVFNLGYNYGKVLSNTDAAIALYNLLHRLISDGHSIVLNFEGVEIIYFGWVNRALAPLAKDFTPDVLKQQLQCVKLTDDNRNLINLSFRNAYSYYKELRKYESDLTKSVV